MDRTHQRSSFISQTDRQTGIIAVEVGAGAEVGEGTFGLVPRIQARYIFARQNDAQGRVRVQAKVLAVEIYD